MDCIPLGEIFSNYAMIDAEITVDFVMSEVRVVLNEVITMTYHYNAPIDLFCYDGGDA